MVLSGTDAGVSACQHWVYVSVLSLLVVATLLITQVCAWERAGSSYQFFAALYLDH